MHRALRIALIVIALPVLLCLLMWGALMTLGNTAWGRQRIEALVAGLTANQVRLVGLGGDLPDRLTLHELQLADAHGVWLRGEGIEVTWRPWALLQRRVAVDTAHAQRIDWSRLPVSDSHSGGQTRIPDIDVHELTADTVNLSAALAGTPASLNLHASAHLRSLEDMQLAFAASRLDGEGTYSLQLAFDPERMDGAFNLREPDHGPLAGLLGVAAIGAVQVSGELSGPREAEHVSLHASLGDLHGSATGVVDLVRESADVQYAADAAAMAPRPDLSWQRLHVQGTWHGTLATAVAAGQLQALALALPGGLRIGALDASLEAHEGDLSARARIADAVVPGMPVGLLSGASLAVEGSIRLKEASRPFELRVSHPAFSVRARGQAAGTRTVDADLEAGDVAKLLAAIPGGLSGPLRLHATAQQTGTPVQWRLTASGNLDSTDPLLHSWFRGPQTADIRGSYGVGELRLDRSVVAGRELSLALSGRMSAPRRPDAPWIVTGESGLTLGDLSLLLPTLSGQATIRADLSGNTAALRLAGDLQAAVAVRDAAPGMVQGTFDLGGLPHDPRARLQLRGALAGEPVTLLADVQVHPGQTIEVGIGQADWRSVHAQGDITLARDLDRSHGQMNWSIANLADLNGLLGQNLGGSLSGMLSLVPEAGDSVATRAAQNRLLISTEGLQFGGLNINGTLTGTGPLHALQLSLAARSSILGEPANIAAQGLADMTKNSLEVTAVTAMVHGVDVTLLQPALVDFSHGLAVSGLRARLADAQLVAAGEILPLLHLQAELTDATPALIDAILPGYLASGTLNGTLQLRGTVGSAQGQLHLTGTDLRAAGDAASLPPAQLYASVELAAEGARIALRSTAGESSHLTVEGSVPWSGPIAVEAVGKVDLTRLNPLLESSGQRITGTVDLNARVAGTLDAPTMTGLVQLHKGVLHDYRHGIDLTEIEGTLEGTQNELRITQLTAHAASGTVAVTGTLEVLQGGWPVDLVFKARDAQPFSSSIVTGTLNADLTLEGTALHELTLAGNIAVNRATVQIPNSFPPNVAILDVRRPGQQVVTTTIRGPVINLRVTVDAPRQILVRGRGLDAELGGRVQIGGTARVPTIDGGFDLQRGLFTLANSRLNFTSGRVSFAGSDVTGKIDPILDFTAQTTALDTTVTVHITGVADAPQFELTSIPQLPQDEILARLLFGESAGQLTALQAAQLGAALMTMTGMGSGFNPLVELQKHLGLDRLSVGSNDTGSTGSAQNFGATIEAGRYVTNRIFVDVKQNTAGATQLQVDVDLTNKLKLQTRIGTGTGTAQGTTPDNDPGNSVGLSYRFEY